MEDLRTILDRVLAGVGEMVAERKAGHSRPELPCLGEVRGVLEGDAVKEDTGERKQAGRAT